MEIFNINGRMKAALRGYRYTPRVASAHRRQWQCSLKNSTRCPGSLSTTLENHDPREGTAHNHGPSQAAVDAQRAKAAMANRATTGNARPTEVIAEAVRELNQGAMAMLPRASHLKKNIQNARRGSHTPLDPINLANLGEIPQRYAEVNGQNIILLDTGANAPDRIVAVATPEMLNSLSGSNIWFGDGNFAMSPRSFRQIYVIRFEENGSYFTAVYAMLPAKNRATYERLFEAVAEACNDRGGARVTCIKMDFEDAAMRAASAVFGRHVIFSGCFFHFTQCTWRKIQELNLVNAYRDDEEFRLSCGMLDAIAFLPLADVRDGMYHLRQNAPDEMAPLITYFDQTYVSGRPAAAQPLGNGRAGIVMVRNPPQFPPNTWNVHGATMGGYARTNNACEGWNNAFRSLVGHQHPTVWKTLECIQKVCNF